MILSGDNWGMSSTPEHTPASDPSESQTPTLAAPKSLPKPQLKPRKKTAGYWSKGVFIKDTDEVDPDRVLSRTEEKDASHALQKLGLELVELRKAALDRLKTQGHVTDRLATEIDSFKRATAFEGKRRLGQLLGKIMRGLPDDSVNAIKAALSEQKSGSATEALAIHRLERWRDDLLADDAALARLLGDPVVVQAKLDGNPSSDAQHLRALVRQARKDMGAPVAEGQAPKPSRAHKELFQALKEIFA